MSLIGPFRDVTEIIKLIKLYLFIFLYNDAYLEENCGQFVSYNPSTDTKLEEFFFKLN